MPTQLNQLLLPTGSIVQVQTFVLNSVASGTTIIPVDDTIPQNTEGDQYLSVSITPKNPSNYLVVWVSAFGHTPDPVATGALFRDSGVNAIAVTRYGLGVGVAINLYFDLNMCHFDVAGSINSTTYKFRVGGNGGSQLTMNGTTGARVYGGVASSRIVVLELSA